MKLIDTHCHLDAHYFPAGPGDVLERAKIEGVGAFMVVGVGATLEPARAAASLAASRDDVVAAVGVHPHDASTLDDAAERELRELGSRAGVAAIGEIGLDYHYDHSPRDVQRRVFSRLVRLARDLAKPIVVHTRAAADDTLAILDGEGAREVGGIIHCFSEDEKFARRALELGFDLSFSGIVTFKSARDVAAVAASAPVERIHVETDSPYLAPVPMRGKPCEPAFVLHTARRVAELRKTTLEELAPILWKNAERRLGRTFA
ncbi:MAG TPA: TatD family hydrolase [Polyangiaceae bacterium]